MEQTPKNEIEQRASRGGCLTAFLIFMIIANAFTAVAYIANPAAVQQQYPAVTDSLILLLTAGALLNLGLVALIWRWRKAGVYGFFGVAAVAFIVNISIGIPLPMALFGLAGMVVLAVLVRPKWSQFS